MVKYLLSIVILITTLSANEYKNVAENFLKFKGAEKSITSSELLIKDGKTVGYLFNLSDRGYIVVPVSKSLSPIKAFSFTGDFATPYRNFLENQLLTAIEYGEVAQTRESDKIAKRWEFFKAFDSKVLRNIKSYTPNTTLLTTTWNQHAPYNNFFPSVGDSKTLTGCVQTAMAQLMNFHKYPLFAKGVLEHNATIKNSNSGVDRYEKLSSVLYRNYNWELMSDSFAGEFNQTQTDEVAYLMRDLAIMNQAILGVSETSASNNNYALYKYFGYSKNYKSISSSETTFTDIFNIIKSQVDLEQPVLLSLPGHMVVADGYFSDSTGNFIHLNMGWGGASNDFYNLDYDISAESYNFRQSTNNDISISYDLKPCSEEANDCFVNLEQNDSILDYQNLTLEDGDSFNQYQNLTLEDGDLIDGNHITGASTDYWEYDKYEVYLSGDTTINRSNKYYEIGIYKLNGTEIVKSVFDNLDSLNVNLEAGKYVIQLYSGGYGAKDYDINFTTETLTDSEIDNIENTINRENIIGNLDSDSDIDEFEIYLKGDVAVIRSNQSSNIAIYEMNGTLISESLRSNLSENLPLGKYKIRFSRSNSQGSYIVNDISDYLVTIMTEPISNSEKLDIENSLNRFQIIGELTELKDIDEYQLYFSGKVSIIRDSSSYNYALYDSDNNMIQESDLNSDNLYFENLPTGKYRLAVGFFNSSGYYSGIQNKSYNLTVLAESLSDSEKDIIEQNLNNPPEIDMELKDIIISKPIDILLNIFDKDGDELNISIFRDNNFLDVSLRKNILSISPKTFETSSDIILKIVSKGGEVEKRFKVVTTSENIAFGKKFNVSGKFENGTDIYSNKIILGGVCSISGSRGYSNQAFYLSLDNRLDENLVDFSESEITTNSLSQDIYVAKSKLGGYIFAEDFSNYTLSVSCPDSDDNISRIASILNISSEIGDNSLSNIFELTQEPNDNLNITLYLNSGWNLVSNPTDVNIELSTVPNLNYSFKYIDGEWLLWENGNYGGSNIVNFESFVQSNGYWFNISLDSELNLVGSKTDCPDISGLTTGWHLLGSCETTNFDEVFSQNENALIIYTFNGSWNGVGSSTELNLLLQNSGISQISELSASQGFWIFIK